MVTRGGGFFFASADRLHQAAQLDLRVHHASLLKSHRHVKNPDDLPEDILADEKHTRFNGQKVYIATTVANDCVLGASVSLDADTEGLTEAYGHFKTEATNSTTYRVQLEGILRICAPREAKNPEKQNVVANRTVDTQRGQYLHSMIAARHISQCCTSIGSLQFLVCAPSDVLPRTTGYGCRVMKRCVYPKLNRSHFCSVLVLGQKHRFR